jgi:hypothetical protein
MNTKHLQQGTISFDERTYESHLSLFSRTTQFVYVPNKDSFFSTLDQHADALEGDVKPLVVLGSEGMISLTPAPQSFRREWQECISCKLGCEEKINQAP